MKPLDERFQMLIRDVPIDCRNHDMKLASSS